VDTATVGRPGPERLLGELNHLLWRQRSLMTELCYRLEVQQLLLANDQDRWLSLCAEEVDRTLARIARHEEAQGHLMDELAAHLPVTRSTTLGGLGEVVDEPWDGILGEHRAAFLSLIAEAEQLSRENRDLLQSGLDDVRRLIGRIGGADDEAVPARPSAGDAAYRELGRRRPAPARSGAALLVDRDV
jgi:hypothetical protein